MEELRCVKCKGTFTRENPRLKETFNDRAVVHCMMCGCCLPEEKWLMWAMVQQIEQERLDAR